MVTGKQRQRLQPPSHSQHELHETRSRNSPRSLRGSTALLISVLWPFSFQRSARIKFCCFWATKPVLIDYGSLGNKYTVEICILLVYNYFHHGLVALAASHTSLSLRFLNCSVIVLVFLRDEVSSSHNNSNVLLMYVFYFNCFFFFHNCPVSNSRQML